MNTLNNTIHTPPGLALTRRSRRAALGTLLVLLLIMLARPGLSHAQTTLPPPVGGTSTVINEVTGADVHRDPHISGSLVAYASVIGGNAEVRFHDLAMAADVAIPFAAGLDFQPDIFGSTIVYTRISSGQWAIYAFDTANASQAPVELDPQVPILREKPAIGGQTAAWMSWTQNIYEPSAIVVYDLATSSATQLTQHTEYNVEPDVSPDGSTIVWARCDNWSNVNGLENCRIWQATRSDNGGWSTATASQVSGDYHSMSPVVGEQYIAHQGIDAAGESDIYWRLRSGGEVHRISLPGDQRNPAISGNVLVFESGNQTDGWDILLYDIATGNAYTVAATTLREFEPDVAIGADGLIRVVWTGAPNYSSANVFARAFTLPSGDTTPPTVTIAAPANASYTLGESVAAAYSCSDESGGSGLVSCVGPDASGSPIDTATVGTKTFTVTAADGAGNSVSETVSYSVTYGLCTLYDESKAHKAGSTVPIKVQLCDASGSSVSTAGAVLHATGLAKVDDTASGDLATPGEANPDDDFRFDPALGGSGGYIFNLSTRGLGAGTWALSFTVSGDPLGHTVTFDVR